MLLVSKEEAGPPWRASTNWLIVDGSLDGSISFDTSISDVVVDCISGGVLLERPEDSLPCEITVFFREKQEIHSIYVRSTARIYEIYYASNQQGTSNEYLCTVRCGAVVSSSTADTCDGKAVLPSSDSKSVEDGWVEVEVRDSILQDGHHLLPSETFDRKIIPKAQKCYEASAEISDAAPCMSVTLRLLSLQMKSSVCVEEIYIYADPVEDTDPEPLPPISNMGAGSLFSMLVPSILQLSRSGTHQLPNKGPDTPQQSISSSMGNTIHMNGSEMLRIEEVGSSSSTEHHDGRYYLQHHNGKPQHPLPSSSKKITDQVQESKSRADEDSGTEAGVDNVVNMKAEEHSQGNTTDRLMISAKENGSDQLPNSMTNGTNVNDVGLKEMMDDLVSRVGRTETFCSSFQENVIKLLTGIDMRLQRMELQMDVLTKEFHSSEKCTSKFLPPEFSDHESNSEKKCGTSSFVGDSCSRENEDPDDESINAMPELQSATGLVVKAPEFPIEDDDDHDDGNDFSNNSCNFVDSTPELHPQKGKYFSIDDALASELAAFHVSATEKTSDHKSYMIDVPQEQNSADHALNSSFLTFQSEAANHWSLGYNMGDKSCDMTNGVLVEMCHDGQRCSDGKAVDPESKLSKIDIFYGRDAQVLGDNVEAGSLLSNDGSSIEFDTIGCKGVIIKAPEFPSEDILDSGGSRFLHTAGDSDKHLHMLPDSASNPTLALYLSSRSVKPSKCSPNLHAYASEPETVLSPRGSDVGINSGMIDNSHETSSRNNSTLHPLAFFLSQGDLEQNCDNSPHPVKLCGEPSSSMCCVDSMEYVNHDSKFNFICCNHMSDPCGLSENQLLHLCSALHTDGNSFHVWDEECLDDDSNVHNAAIRKDTELIDRDEQAGCNIPSISDRIFIRSLRHPDCSNASSLNSFVGVSADHLSEGMPGNPENSKTKLQCQSSDFASRMQCQFESNKAVATLVLGEDDLISNVKFTADESLRTSLPLEFLLGEEPNDNIQNDDWHKIVCSSIPVGEDCFINLKLSVDTNLRSELSPEVLQDENSENLAERSDHDYEIEIGQDLNSSLVNDLSQSSQTSEKALVELDSLIYSQVSDMLECPQSCNGDLVFSSLI
ncbi:hypothetical protein HPP92_026649 [Vanilla planifolia]|uniref:Uncharacterized protein n=1 Tax=Vanilla planifolia TaxID=51239 RepID=A0A835U7N2_VANPL|nr:hypothetical protein HPP92_026649 [Vanilla planifolia]